MAQTAGLDGDSPLVRGALVDHGGRHFWTPV
jgi:hypothetical protein